jgi:hypothetical protein
MLATQHAYFLYHLLKSYSVSILHVLKNSG